ncbi:protoporphyrinogen/coproporphyrinogen oxidase [Pseudodonghicola flavimaris]|uniref:FAD-dependent oxidoreductase n=1 Tax=Pseudodonghicola flavimaris TaxID=3050036 RepID=A0ABT7F2D8_9RHOB|nr:FAD-dependent oxidoreductase [Pseudodonghicola flavimaris]MDK3018766.1 FAD-dependent oxidoreductase [Pseudodonghicola flavimaris]
MSGTDYDVIVVGAGISGLVAARALQRAGLSVKVLEAGAVPGGRVGDMEVRGIRFNTGARLIYPFSKPFNALLDELGLKDQLIEVRHLSADCIGASDHWTVELMPGPKSLLTPGLTLGDRLRFLPYAAAMMLARLRTDPDDATSAMAADGETLSDHIRRRLGPRVLARMVAPVFRGTRAWNTDDISGAFFASTTPHLLGGSHIWVLKGGMGQLPRALARDLDISCATPVRRVEIDPDGSAKVRADGPDGPLILRGTRLVMAVEGSRVPALMPGLETADRTFFEAVRYNSLGIVHYRLNRDLPARMNFFAADVAGPIATYQQLPGNAATGQAPQLYAQLSPEAVARAKAEGRQADLHPMIADRMRTLYPAFDTAVTDRHEQWIEHKLPVFYPGYAARLRAFLDRRDAAPQTVFFCGDYLTQSLLTGAAASGTRAARTLLRDL